MSHLDDLIAAEEAAQQDLNAARARLDEAAQAVLIERFKDDEHFVVGDIVLVPRTLFGKRKMWPARVEQLHLNYTAGVYRDGEPFESKTISYTVRHANANGNGYAPTSEGYYHRDVAPLNEGRI